MGKFNMQFRAFFGLDPADSDYPALGVESAIPPAAPAPVPPSADKLEAALRTLEHHGFTYDEGRQYWTAPLGRIDGPVKALAGLIAAKRAKEKRDRCVVAEDHARLDRIYRDMRGPAWAQAERAMNEFCTGRPEE